MSGSCADGRRRPWRSRGGQVTVRLQPAAAFAGRKRTSVHPAGNHLDLAHVQATMSAVVRPIRPLALAICISLVAVASAAWGSSQSTPRSDTNIVLHWRDNHRTFTVTPG